MIRGSNLIWLIFLILFAAYTWAFRLLARRGFSFDRKKADHTKQDNLVQNRGKVRSQDLMKIIVFGFLGLVVGGMIALPRIDIFVGWLSQHMGWGGNENGTPTFFLSAVCMVCSLAVFTFYIRRKLYFKRLYRTVLWLRRFHQDGLFLFDLVLDDICRGVALPITLEDTTVPKSSLTGQLHPLFSR